MQFFSKTWRTAFAATTKNTEQLLVQSAENIGIWRISQHESTSVILPWLWQCKRKFTGSSRPLNQGWTILGLSKSHSYWILMHSLLICHPIRCNKSKLEGSPIFSQLESSKPWIRHCTSRCDDELSSGCLLQLHTTWRTATEWCLDVWAVKWLVSSMNVIRLRNVLDTASSYCGYCGVRSLAFKQVESQKELKPDVINQPVGTITSDFHLWSIRVVKKKRFFQV